MEPTTETATIQLPARLDPGSVSPLADELDGAIASPARVVVLLGAGEGVFCLGLDIGDSHKERPDVHAFADVLLLLHRARKPTLAVVDGRAIGGGLGLAASCDWVVATERSTFALPELLWGLVPAMIWPVVTDRMAPHAARRWTMSAHARSVAEAAAAGLVDEVIASPPVSAVTSPWRREAVDSAPMCKGVRRAVRMLARLDPVALVRFREWARSSRALSTAQAVADGAAITDEMIRTPAVRQRWAAFESGEAPWT